MKYLIVSDNHGDRQILVDLLAEFSGKVDTFIHCVEIRNCNKRSPLANLSSGWRKL